jgi:hypothetical protein
LPLLLAAQLAFDPDLDEQHLGDFVEGRCRIEVLAVANDVVARMEQVGELVFLEGLQLLDEFFNLLVAGIGMRDILDFLAMAGQLVLAGSPVAGFTVVVRDEERGRCSTVRNALPGSSPRP